MEGHLEKLRSAEINRIKYWFKPCMRVLEIGGGSGYQAGVIASWGCKVLSIDIPNRPVPQKQYHPVQDYDGKNIPFPDANFDIVFSSNVLEHIQPLSPIFTEMHRVLKPGGLVVHIIPSSTWRFWTSIAHYVYLLKKYLLGQMQPIPSVENAPSVSDKAVKHGIAYVIKRALLAGPHGEYPNALSELYYFSKGRWVRVFQSNGFDVVETFGNGLFYTGYGLFPSMSLETRRSLANFLGSSCNTFIMRIKPFQGKFKP